MTKNFRTVFFFKKIKIKERKIHNNRAIATAQEIEDCNTRNCALVHTHAYVCFCMLDINMLCMCSGMYECINKLIIKIGA